MNEYTLKDSFEFAKDMNNQNSNFVMDLETYFYVPLDEMFEMLSLSLKESFILFDNKYYSQIDGISMRSPLRLALANIFLCYHEGNWVKDCPKDFRLIYYKRYVDDIFVLFNEPEHAQFFLKYINKKHKNMKFSIETEINSHFFFLM